MIILSYKQCSAVATCRLHIGIPPQLFIFPIFFCKQPCFDPTRKYMKKKVKVTCPWNDEILLAQPYLTSDDLTQLQLLNLT